MAKKIKGILEELKEIGEEREEEVIEIEPVKGTTSKAYWEENERRRMNIERKMNNCGNCKNLAYNNLIGGLEVKTCTIKNKIILKNKNIDNCPYYSLRTTINLLSDMEQD